MDENGMSNIISSLIRNNGDGLGGSNAIWLIFLLFLCFNGGGVGWGGRGNYATQQDVTQGFYNQDLTSAVRANADAISQLGVQSMGQANNIAQAINHAEDMTMAGFANTNNNICNLKYEMAQNTSAITTNATANTQAILDRLCSMEAAQQANTIAQLRTDLQAAQLALSNAGQTQNIVAALRTPAPVPAYVVSPPCQALTGTAIS